MCRELSIQEIEQELAKQASTEEIKKERRRCWSPNCNHKAFLEDYGGWKWCLKHWYINLRFSGGSKWYYFKTTRLF